MPTQVLHHGLEVFRFREGSSDEPGCQEIARDVPCRLHCLVTISIEDRAFAPSDQSFCVNNRVEPLAAGRHTDTGLERYPQRDAVVDELDTFDAHAVNLNRAERRRR